MKQIALTSGGEKAQVQSVLLLTDGLANHGITNRVGIIEQMKKMQSVGLAAVEAAPPPSRRSPFAMFSKSKGKKKRSQPPQMQQQAAQPPSPPMAVSII